MPVYEYRCSDCSTKFEKLTSLSRAHQQPSCPHCQGGNTYKLLSTFASVRGAVDGAGSVVSSGSGCAGCSGGHCSSCH